MIEIKPIGNYWYPDANGIIPNLSKPTNDYSEMKYLCGLVEEHVHSFAVRGSWTRNNWREGISDVDMVIFLHDHDNDKIRYVNSVLLRERENDTCKCLRVAEPTIIGYKSISPWQRTDLSINSYTIWGENYSIPKYTFDYFCANYNQWFAGFEPKYKHSSPGFTSGKWILRRAFLLVMRKEGYFTRDMYPCLKAFTKYYPEHTDIMEQCVHLVINERFFTRLEQLKIIREGRSIVENLYRQGVWKLE